MLINDDHEKHDEPPNTLRIQNKRLRFRRVARSYVHIIQQSICVVCCSPLVGIYVKKCVAISNILRVCDFFLSHRFFDNRAKKKIRNVFGCVCIGK